MRSHPIWMALVGRPSLVCALVAGALAVGCDGSGDGSPGPAASPDAGTTGPSTAMITVQEIVALSTFQDMVAADADLAAVADGLDIALAGKVEDSDGVTLHWGEASDGVTSVIRRCVAEACTVARQTHTAQGLAWAAADGSPLEVAGIGRPVLLKDLIGYELTGLTAVASGGLTIASDDVPAIDFARRRFVALNTFGDALSTNLDSLTSVAKQDGGFDEVTEIQYAREQDVTAALRDLDAMDVLFWLSQGVREEKLAGWLSSSTIGLTVNRAGFGDKTMDRNALEGPAQGNVAGGPGIVFLAASQSYSDGSEGQPDNKSIWQRFDWQDDPTLPRRVVVGVQGHTSASRVVLAAAAFFDAYLSGDKTLAEAVAAGNGVLAGTGAKLVTNQKEAGLAKTYLRRYSDLWKAAPFQPTLVKAWIPMWAQWAKCDGETQTEDFATAWAELTFDGAYFEGERGPTSPSSTVDTTIRGVLTGFEVGDRIFFEASGNMDKPKYQDFLAYGDGTIREVETKDSGQLVLHFNGPVNAAHYRNELGQDCVLNNPVIANTTGDLGRLELTP